MSHSSGLGYDFLTPELLQYKQYTKDEENPLVTLVRGYHSLLHDSSSGRFTRLESTATPVRTRRRLGVLVRARLGRANRKPLLFGFDETACTKY